MIDYRNIRVIGFDLDQTLYPKSPEIDEAIQKYIYEKIAEHRGCGIEEAARLFQDLYQGGRGLSGSKSVMALGVPDAKEIVQEALERATIAEALHSDDRTIALLRELKARYQALDLITGSNLVVTQKKLRALEIPETLFSHIITADNASKSDSSAYLLWLSYYELKPDQFLYIGDRVMSDYEAPKKLGIASILVNIAKPDPTLSVLQLQALFEIKTYL